MAFFSREPKLWKDGEATLGFVTPQQPLSREKRFTWNSIYWPQRNQSTQTNKKRQSDAERIGRSISKLIDQEEKNQLRISKVKTLSDKKLLEKKKMNGGKSSPSRFRQTGFTTLSKDNQEVIKRLTFHSEKKMRQSRLRDRHGWRSNILENEENQFLVKINEKKLFRGTSKGFCQSRKVNLDLPHNYYPGPGAYEITRFLEEEKIRKN